MKSTSPKMHENKMQETNLESAKVKKKQYVKPVAKVFVIETENGFAAGSQIELIIDGNANEIHVEDWIQDGFIQDGEI